MKTLLKNANVLSMKNDEIAYRTDVVIENARIAYVGKAAPETLTQGANAMDCTGKFVMPGLFDCHTHMATTNMAELFIACGVTSIRNMSGSKLLLDFAAKQKAAGADCPNLYCCSPIYDGADSSHKPDSHRFISNNDEAEQAVYSTIEDGYRWVKTYPEIAPDVYKHLMDTANGVGIKVCGHMSKRVDDKVLRDWGYHCCEHSSSLPSHPADIEYLSKSGMWFCPTQVVCETLPDYVWNGKQFTDLEYYAYIPQPTRDLWNERNAEIIEGYKKLGLRPDINVIINRGKKFMEYSDKYLAGSDSPYPGMIPGFSLHDELYKLVHLYGCTPYEALRAATVSPARYIGISDQTGTVEPGKDADLLILERSPLADIRNTLSINAVMLAGRLLDGAYLDKLRARLRALPAEEVVDIDPVI